MTLKEGDIFIDRDFGLGEAYMITRVQGEDQCLIKWMTDMEHEYAAHIEIVIGDIYMGNIDTMPLFKLVLL